MDLNNMNWLEIGKKIWINAKLNPQRVFEEGIVVQINKQKKNIVIELNSGTPQAVKTTAYLYQIQKCTYDENEVQDMVDLQQLSEAELLHNVERRYNRDMIFTYCGPTLLVVNPYKQVAHLFEDQSLLFYQLQTFCQNFQYKAYPPHIYALSSFALWQLFDNQKNQAVVISGESGAGKTQNTKFSLNFLASLSKNLKELIKNEQLVKKFNSSLIKVVDRGLKKINKKEEFFGIEEKILGCNDILQAFGNAKTIRNDNSSRFGKLILIMYGETKFDIKEAFIQCYLLEKSRICSQSAGQRNYHIFYCLLKGCKKQQLQSLNLFNKMQEYNYINQGNCYQAGSRNDIKEFEKVVSDFEKMGFNEYERKAIMQVVAAVLIFGQIKFRTFINNKNEDDIEIKTQQEINDICELLGSNSKDMNSALTTKIRKIGKNTIISPLKLQQSMALRDSFSRSLYQQMFFFLVGKLNKAIQIEGGTQMDDISANRDSRKSIGVLDIFGFQVLKINSLQQVFINFANEKLQQLYVSYIFKEEKEVFFREGLKQFAINFQFEDNKPVIDLFEAPPIGLFFLINQASQLNKKQSVIIQSIAKSHGKSSNLIMPKGKSQLFTILHSCSPVDYNVNGFSQRNKDDVPQPIIHIFSKMKADIQHVINFQQSAQKKSKYLASKFIADINKLIEELYYCDCHFVRCIKCNTQKKSNCFVPKFALVNMRYLGVLDSIRIRKLGYIYRRTYLDFLKKFGEIMNYKYKKDVYDHLQQDQSKQVAKKLMGTYAKECQTENLILFGKQKILIKQKGLNVLQFILKQRKKNRIDCANMIKNCFLKHRFRAKVAQFFIRMKRLRYVGRKYIIRIKERIVLKKIIRIQREWKEILYKRRLKKNRQKNKKFAQRMIAKYRMLKQRRLYRQFKNKVIKIQRWWMDLQKTNKFKKYIMGRAILRRLLDKGWQKMLHHKAILIQKHWRSYFVQKRFKKKMQEIKRAVHEAFINRKATLIQKQYRMHRFRVIMKVYKKAACKIQAWCKARWMNKVYLKVRQSTITIQRLSKNFILKRKICTAVEKRCQDVITALTEDKKKSFYNPISQKNQIQFSVLDVKFSIEDDSFTWWEKWPQTFAKVCNDLKNENILKIYCTKLSTILITNKGKIIEIEETNINKKIHYQTQQFKNVDKIFPQFNNGYSLSLGDTLILNKKIPFKIADQKQKIKIQQIVNMKNTKIYYFNNNECLLQIHKIHQKSIFYRRLHFKKVIVSIANSINFCILMDVGGMLYGLGSNEFGQLGMGHFNRMHQTKQLEWLKHDGQMAQRVVVGLQHTICLTRLGKVYCWGNNIQGQLGCGKDIKQSQNPILLKYNKQVLKSVQVAAGAKSTLLLSNLMQVYWFGQNQHLKRQFLPKQVSIKGKGKIVVNIGVAWNKTFSISYIHTLQKEYSKAKTTQQFLQTCKNLSKEWKNNQLFPQYDEQFQKILNLKMSDMRVKKKPSAIITNEDPFPFKMIDCIQGKQKNNFKQMIRSQLLKLINKSPSLMTAQEKSFLDHLNNPKIKSFIKKM